MNPGDLAEVRDLVQRELRGSDLGVLVRQLQGSQVGWAKGVAVVTGTGTRQASATVPHGLSDTPSVVVATSDDVGLVEAVDTKTTSSFRVLLNHVDGTAWSGGRSVYWIAVV